MQLLTRVNNLFGKWLEISCEMSRAVDIFDSIAAQ